MRKFVRASLVACLFLSLQSCVSLVAQSKTAFGDEDCSFPTYTYGGTIASVLIFGSFVTEVVKEPAVIIGGVLLLVDFPFTVALDTITLPLSVTRDVVACIKRYNSKTLPTDDQGKLKLGQAIPPIFILTNTPHKKVIFITKSGETKFIQI